MKLYFSENLPTFVQLDPGHWCDVIELSSLMIIIIHWISGNMSARGHWSVKRTNLVQYTSTKRLTVFTPIIICKQMWRHNWFSAFITCTQMWRHNWVKVFWYFICHNYYRQCLVFNGQSLNVIHILILFLDILISPQCAFDYCIFISIHSCDTMVTDFIDCLIYLFIYIALKYD